MSHSTAHPAMGGPWHLNEGRLPGQALYIEQLLTEKHGQKQINKSVFIRQYGKYSEVLCKVKLIFKVLLNWLLIFYLCIEA